MSRFATRRAVFSLEPAQHSDFPLPVLAQRRGAAAIRPGILEGVNPPPQRLATRTTTFYNDPPESTPRNYAVAVGGRTVRVDPGSARTTLMPAVRWTSKSTRARSGWRGLLSVERRGHQSVEGDGFADASGPPRGVHAGTEQCPAFCRRSRGWRRKLHRCRRDRLRCGRSLRHVRTLSRSIPKSRGQVPIRRSSHRALSTRQSARASSTMVEIDPNVTRSPLAIRRFSQSGSVDRVPFCCPRPRVQRSGRSGGSSMKLRNARMAEDDVLLSVCR
jgi:hypothetical protein